MFYLIQPIIGRPLFIEKVLIPSMGLTHSDDYHEFVWDLIDHLRDPDRLWCLWQYKLDQMVGRPLKRHETVKAVLRAR